MVNGKRQSKAKIRKRQAKVGQYFIEKKGNHYKDEHASISEVLAVTPEGVLLKSIYFLDDPSKYDVYLNGMSHSNLYKYSKPLSKTAYLKLKILRGFNTDVIVN